MTDTVEAIVAPLSAELELEAALHKHQRTSERLARFAREAERLESRLREAERDARRYRWLRDRIAPEELADEVVALFALRTVGPIARRPADDDCLDDVDAAIDRAMEGEDGKTYWPATPANGEPDWTGYD